MTDIETLKKLCKGEWVDTDDVQRILGISFHEGLKIFDFSRTAEWWSIVGETPEERQRNGQKITTCFRLKNQFYENELAQKEKRINELIRTCRIFEIALNREIGVDHAYTNAFEEAEREYMAEQERCSK